MAKDILYPLRHLHGQMHEAKLRYTRKKAIRKQFRSMKRKNPRTVFLVLTPEHGNLGDHAITYAEICMLKEKGISCLEVTEKQLQEWKHQGVLNVMNGYPILINGGGNLGTLWFHIEEMQRDIIRNSPKSPIMILPNTIYYEQDDWGKKEFEESGRIYNQHRNLLLYSREKFSYEIMLQAYNRVKLIPDMVLSLPHCGNKQERNGCLVCLRSDREKTRTTEQEQVIREQAKLLFGENVSDTDMLADAPVSAEQRESVLQAKFDQLARAELVITDRLHGMIFCAITGTPCIVIDSKSPKLRGCYEWIRNLDYIRFAERVEDIAEEYRKIPAAVHKYDNSHLTHYYEQLAQDIEAIL